MVEERGATSAVDTLVTAPMPKQTVFVYIAVGFLSRRCYGARINVEIFHIVKKSTFMLFVDTKVIDFAFKLRSE